MYASRDIRKKGKSKSPDERLKLPASCQETRSGMMTTNDTDELMHEKCAQCKGRSVFPHTRVVEPTSLSNLAFASLFMLLE